ncbi:MAG: hypothetical protein ACRCX2_21615, partial [Paraclostridium sp.]
MKKEAVNQMIGDYTFWINKKTKNVYRVINGNVINACNSASGEIGVIYTREIIDGKNVPTDVY